MEDDIPLGRLSYFEKDWFKKAPQKKCGFLLDIDDDWTFSGFFHGPPLFSNDGDVGSFRECLWEEEVVELFIRNHGEAEYLEFNLSPHGEWWGGYFTDYRQRSAVLSDWKERCTIKTHQHDGIWNSKLVIPGELLSTVIDLEKPFRLNATAVIGDKEKQFLTWLKPKTKKPDFHRIIARA